jgi:hypothetical protein
VASIGLRVYDPGANSLSLADTLAKGVFGDPEAQAKAQLIASQVHAHDAYTAKLAADTGLVGIKTIEEQRDEEARNAAANLTNNPLVASVAPVPVTEAPRPSPDFSGPGMPVIAGAPAGGEVAAYNQAQRMHDANVAAGRALWPVIVRTGKAEDLYKTIGAGVGYNTLAPITAGGTTPTGDAARVGSELFTGKTPTVSDVTVGSDISGVQAATAGKIAEEAAKPIFKGEPGQGLGVQRFVPDPTAPGGYRAVTITGSAGEPTPYGADTAGREEAEYQRLRGKIARGEQLSPNENESLAALTDIHNKATNVKRETITGANGEIIELMPDGTQRVISTPSGLGASESGREQTVLADLTARKQAADAGQGAPLSAAEEKMRSDLAVKLQPKPINVPQTDQMVTPVEGGVRPTPGAPTPPGADPNNPWAGDKTLSGQDRTVFTNIWSKFRDPNAAITPQEAQLYSTAFTGAYGKKWVEKTDENGQPYQVQVSNDPPPGAPSVAQIFARAGVNAPGQPAQPPGPNEPVQPVQPVQPPGPNQSFPIIRPMATMNGLPPKPLTDAQAKDVRFVNNASLSNKYMDNMDEKSIPNSVLAWVANPQQSGSGLMVSIARSAMPDSVKLWLQNALEFTAAVNYEQSGAAVTADEWTNARSTYIPMPGDSDAVLARKREARRFWMIQAASTGYGNRAAQLDGFLNNNGLQPPAAKGGDAARQKQINNLWLKLSPADQVRLRQNEAQ